MFSNLLNNFFFKEKIVQQEKLLFSDLLDFEQKTHNKTYVIFFSTPWCAPCKKLKPTIKKIEKNYPHIIFYELNTEIELYSMIARRFSIKSLPTMIFVEEGRTVDYLIGFKPEQKYFNILDTFNLKENN